MTTTTGPSILNNGDRRHFRIVRDSVEHTKAGVKGVSGKLWEGIVTISKSTKKKITKYSPRVLYWTGGILYLSTVLAAMVFVAFLFVLFMTWLYAVAPWLFYALAILWAINVIAGALTAIFQQAF